MNINDLESVYKQKKLANYLKSPTLLQQDKDSICEELNRLGPRVFQDFEDAMEYDKAVKSGAFSKVVGISPPVSMPISRLNEAKDVTLLIRQSDLSDENIRSLRNKGLDALRSKQVACVLLAGGQGSRLGFNGPKGCFRLSRLPSKSSIFRILMTRLRRLEDIAETKIPLYIMTSVQNDAAIRTEFETNDYFGLTKEDVYFFCQTEMPSFSLNGDIHLADSGHITHNPNGNGGVFESLLRTGALKDMERRQVRYLHVFGVDNVLAKVADPLFIGLCIESGAPAGNKCCQKRDAHEKVGVAVAKHLDDGRTVSSVVEYSEMRPEDAEAIDASGRLSYSAGNICQHFFTLELIKGVVSGGLRYHVAVKKIPYWDSDRRAEVSDMKEPNGIKLEYFIFDAFEHASQVCILEVERSEEFSPVKNASGADSPDSAVHDILSLHAKWRGSDVLGEFTPGTVYGPEDASLSSPFTVVS